MVVAICIYLYDISFSVCMSRVLLYVVVIGEVWSLRGYGHVGHRLGGGWDCFTNSAPETLLWSSSTKN